MDTYDYFLAALKHYCQTEGRSSQSYLAAATKLSEGFISALLSGIKRAGTKSQDALAHAAGYELVDFLLLGRSILTGEPMRKGRGVMDEFHNLCEILVDIRNKSPEEFYQLVGRIHTTHTMLQSRRYATEKKSNGLI